MLTRDDDFAALRRTFRWEVPQAFNIAVAVCDRHADADNRLALIEERGEVREYGFADLRRGARSSSWPSCR